MDPKIDKIGRLFFGGNEGVVFFNVAGLFRSALVNDPPLFGDEGIPSNGYCGAEMAAASPEMECQRQDMSGVSNIARRRHMGPSA